MTLYENAFFFFKNVLLFHRLLLLVLHLVLQLIPLLLFSFLTFFFLVMFSCRSPPLSTVSSFIFKRPFISVFFSVLLSFGFPFLFNVLPCSLFIARSLALSLLRHPHLRLSIPLPLSLVSFSWLLSFILLFLIAVFLSFFISFSFFVLLF